MDVYDFMKWTQQDRFTKPLSSNDKKKILTKIKTVIAGINPKRLTAHNVNMLIASIDHTLVSTPELADFTERLTDISNALQKLEKNNPIAVLNDLKDYIQEEF